MLGVVFPSIHRETVEGETPRRIANRFRRAFSANAFLTPSPIVLAITILCRFVNGIMVNSFHC